MLDNVIVRTRLDVDRCPYPTLYPGQEAVRPHGREGLVLKLDAVEEVSGCKRVRSFMVAWVNSSRTRFSVKDQFDYIPVEVFVRNGGTTYSSVWDWYRWLNWIPAYCLEVIVAGESYTFADPEDAARQMTERGITGLVSNPILLGIELERTWSKRETSD